MKARFKNRFFAVLLVIALFLLGFMINAIFDGGNTPPSHLVGIIVTPIQNLFSSIGDSFSGFIKSINDYDSLKKENDSLRQRIIELEDQLNENALLDVENEKLRELLEIKAVNPEKKFVYANVVSVNTSGFKSGFQINQGSLAGIKRKDVVITTDGLVGYVENVGLYYADVKTIIDNGVSVGAKITRTGDMAMTEGSLEYMLSDQLLLSYIPKNSTVRRGDIVYTSGLNGTYPVDIRIGTIEEIIIDDNGLSMSAVINPSVDFNNIRDVYVIVGYDKGGAND